MAATSDRGLTELRQRMGLIPLAEKAGKVECLKCEKYFKSADRARIRVCHVCKGGDTWRAQGIATSSTSEKIRLKG